MGLLSLVVLTFARYSAKLLIDIGRDGFAGKRTFFFNIDDVYGCPSTQFRSLIVVKHRFTHGIAYGSVISKY